MRKPRMIRRGILLTYALLTGMALLILGRSALRGEWMLVAVGAAVTAALMAMFVDLRKRL